MANGKIVVINSVKGIVSSKAKEAVMKAVLTSKENDSYIENSILGTPIYDNLILGTLIKENRYLNLLGETESFAGLKLNQVLITPTATNNIVTKPIQGKNGTIKQYISKGDVSLSIRGTISGKYNQDTGKWLSPREVGTSYHPKEELKLLVKICQAGYSIPVTSDFLNEILGIDNIVITDYSLPQEAGARYNQVFEIEALSDKENILTFTEADVNDSEKLATILGV